ncbi:AAA family ATPase [Fibrobacterota bacterium]
MTEQTSLEPKDIPALFDRITSEISKIIVGQHEVIKKMFIALLCKSHALLIGVPGLAKTTMVDSFAGSLDLNFNRIQFTPDLMPADITGTEILQEDRTTGKRELVFHRGPVFTQVLLGDEINRTPPKTQSALLQAMQEKKVTIFGKTETLEDPFMVIATQNPIEQEGTYPLPEAQLDRFLFSINMDYPDEAEEMSIVKKHTSPLTDTVTSALSKHEILRMQDLVLSMTVSEHVYEYAVKLVRSTRPGNGPDGSFVNKYVQWGAGPRATSFLVMAAKGNALLDGRPIPTEKDIDEVLFSTLNHRIILNFQAEAEGVTFSNLLKNLK